jgi:hypothetical protein
MSKAEGTVQDPFRWACIVTPVRPLGEARALLGFTLQST